MLKPAPPTESNFSFRFSSSWSPWPMRDRDIIAELWSLIAALDAHSWRTLSKTCGEPSPASHNITMNPEKSAVPTSAGQMAQDKMASIVLTMQPPHRLTRHCKTVGVRQFAACKNIRTRCKIIHFGTINLVSVGNNQRGL